MAVCRLCDIAADRIWHSYRLGSPQATTQLWRPEYAEPRFSAALCRQPQGQRRLLCRSFGPHADRGAGDLRAVRSAIRAETGPVVALYRGAGTGTDGDAAGRCWRAVLN